MSFSRLLRVFGDTCCIQKGRTVHGRMITSGFYPDVYTNNHLVCMYSKFDQIDDAHKVFDRMPARNLISWTSLISGYSKLGMANEALTCFRLMVGEGFDPNHYTYVAALSACARLEDARSGKEIHASIYRIEQELNGHVSNCLINMYGKCGMLSFARRVFHLNLEPSSVSLTSLLSSYCQCGENVEALEIFLHSQKVGVMINEFSCASVLGSCSALEDLKVGMQVHSLAVKCGIRLDPFIVTGLISLYAKCGEFDLARCAFLEVDKPHLSAYTTFIGGCVQLGKGGDAINTFCELHSSALKPNERTFSAILGAFADAMVIEVGKQLHCLIIKFGFISITVVGNAVLDFYAKCELLDESMRTFDDMYKPDVVSWNALISGHARSGHYVEAIELLNRMFFQGFDPSLYTYSSILSICGDIPAIEWGKQTHGRIIKPGFDSSVVVGTALIDMYAKCGRLCEARKSFDKLPLKNLISWNTMLVGYSQHGLGRQALEFFELMDRDGIKPNDITFIGVLSACVHVGLIEEGLYHFNSMTKDHGIAPRMDHIACMVNLFAQKGQTKRAYEFIQSFHMDMDKVVWRCLLSGCKTHKDLALGSYAAEKILSIDPEDTSAHIMLSNIYGEAKMWDELAQVRRVLKEKALRKDLGYSWIELRNKIYSFTAGHSTYFDEKNPHKILNELTAQLIDAGYLPDFMSSLHSAQQSN